MSWDLNLFGKSFSKIPMVLELQELVISQPELFQPVLDRFKIPSEVSGLGPIGGSEIARLWCGLFPVAYALSFPTDREDNPTWFPYIHQILPTLVENRVSTRLAILFVRECENLLLRVVISKPIGFRETIRQTTLILENNLKLHLPQENLNGSESDTSIPQG